MTGRDPIDVIDAILEELPERELGLRGRLERIKDEAGYTPPEGVRLIWGRLTEALNRSLPYPPKEEWQKEVFRVVTQEEPPEEEET